MKKFLKFICLISALCCLANTIFAAVVEPVLPQWENAAQVTCAVSFNENTGKVRTYIYGNPGTTSISGTLKLYSGNTEIESWNISGSRTASVMDTFTGISGNTYKLVLDVDITTNGVVENIDMEDSARCP